MPYRASSIPTTLQPAVGLHRRSELMINANFLEPVSGGKSTGEAFRFLRALQEFSDVSDTELKTLSESSRFATLDPGQFITVEGDEESAYGFIVASGLLAMIKTSLSGKELIVELLQANDIFGMLLTLAGDKLPAQLSARSLGHSQVLWLPIKNFARLLSNHPALFSNFTAHLLLCLQSSYRLSRGLAHDRVEVRIAAVLSSLALKFAASDSIDHTSFTVKFTRQQIADLMGTTPETAIRVTRAMQRQGLIDIKRPGIIRIVKLHALQAMVEA